MKSFCLYLAFGNAGQDPSACILRISCDVASSLTAVSIGRRERLCSKRVDSGPT